MSISAEVELSLVFFSPNKIAGLLGKLDQRLVSSAYRGMNLRYQPIAPKKPFDLGG